jgi:CHAT domain-containing protein
LDFVVSGTDLDYHSIFLAPNPPTVSWKSEAATSTQVKNQFQHYPARATAVEVKVSAVVVTIIILLATPSATTIVGQVSSGSPRQKAISGRLSLLADKAVVDGDRLRTEWKRDSLRMAINKYTQAQLYFHGANSPRREAEILKRLGDLHSILSNYPSAVDYYKRALQLARNVSDEQLEVDILNQIANAYLETANVKKAFPYCIQAQAISRRIRYQQGAAHALNHLGVISLISSDVLQAQENLNQALIVWQQVDQDSGRAYTLLNLGYLHSNVGNMKASLESYELARAIWQAIGDQQKEALTLTAMGGVYALEGEKQKASNLHNEALKLFKRMGNRNGEAATLNGIGYLYDDLGERGKALKCYTQALDLYRSIGNRNYAAITLGYVGRVYFALGEKQKALEFYKQKLNTSREMQDRRMEAYTLKDIGNVLSSTDHTKALEYYQQALTLSHSVMDRRGEAYILSSIGSLYEQSGNERQALYYHQQALTLMQAVTDRRGEISTLYNIARAERNLGNLTEARNRIEKSLVLIENLRTKVMSPSLRISYVDTVYQHYEFYIDLLMRMNRRDPTGGYGILALEANEHARARTLLENLIEARTDIRQGVDPQLLAEETRLRQQLNQKAEFQMRLLSGKHTPEQAASIKKEIEILLAQVEEVESRVRDQNPRHMALTQPGRLKLPELQEQLDPHTLLLEYSLGGERSYGWAVTRTSVTSFELPGRLHIEAAAKESYQLLAANKARRKNESSAEHRARLAQAAAAYPARSAALSKILLEPIGSLLGRKRLVIVTDGVLQYIPFSSLPEPGQGSLDSKTWKPLIVDHEVISLPSMSTLAALREVARGRPRPEKALAILADPVFERDDPRLKFVTNKNVTLSLASKQAKSDEFGARGRLIKRAAQELGTNDETVILQRLPFTLQEAQAILTTVPEKETRRALGFDASLTTALDPALRQYRIIHFATHGLLNNAHPELSGIVLSLIDRSGRPQDGFLQLNKIYNLDLPAELVVLSACQTGLGKEARGEGLISLTRGFMYAGASRVMASLWRIDDRAAAELMRYFYEAMFWQHLSPAAALRAAQIRMWQTDEWRFPYYWAAFVLQGEWS